jgi:hypothetical protein
MVQKISLALISGFLLMVVIASTCNSSYTCPADPATQIDSTHATYSPVASKVFLQRLQSDSCKEKGNFKLFVQYPADEYSKDSLAFLHEGNILLLRDNGVFPDIKANDQEYACMIRFDTTELKKLYSNDVIARMGATDVDLVEFDGREVVKSVRTAANKLDARIDFNALLIKGERVEVKNIFPALDNIRNKSLYIIDLTVVEDKTRTLLANPATSNPDGAWTFNKIMQNLANTAATGISTEDFTLQWLQTWLKPGNTVNGDVLTVKNGITPFINAWKQPGTQKLDMRRSPFKLLAIVNRLDLMENPAYGTSGNGGELRFVFGLMQNNNPVSCVIIFEFGVNKKGKELQDYAAKWAKLSTLTVGTAPYNSLLQEITDDITAAGKNPVKPNGSNLNQLRTDEIAFGGSWELREFNINATTHLLNNVTIKQEPAGKFNSDPAMKTMLHNFALQQEKNIEKNRYSIPEKFSGNNMLAGFSQFPNSGVWGDAQGQFIKSNKARFVISINTCSGCHLNEVQTPGFLHDRETAFGAVTSLSGFIRGKNISKPLGTNNEHLEITDIRGIKRSFNDLARRAKVLWGYTNSHPTLFGLQFNPVNMEH